MDTGVAIVTGGARGIGAAVALRLARDGAAVGILDLDLDAARHVAGLASDTGVASVAIAVDVADERSVMAGVAEIAERLGSPSILVSNAGILRDDLMFRMSAADWDLVMNVHLRGAFLTAQAVQPFMRDRGYGRIVALSSTSALGNRGQANYAAAKAGIQGLIKTLAIELGPYGITANAVAPGYILTDMAAQTAGRLGITVDELTARNVAKIPVGRAGTPDDVADAVAYFASERAGFVSGQVLYVAGGPRT